MVVIAINLNCRLSEIRYEMRMTQSDLSNITGIAISLISAYENNKRYPNTYTLWNLANALNCKVDDLYEIVE